MRAHGGGKERMAAKMQFVQDTTCTVAVAG